MPVPLGSFSKIREVLSLIVGLRAVVRRLSNHLAPLDQLVSLLREVAAHVERLVASREK